MNLRANFFCAGYRHPTHIPSRKEDFAKGQQPLSVSAEEKLTLNVLGSATSALKCIRSLKQTHLGMVIYPVKQEKKKKKEEKKQKEVVFFLNCNFFKQFLSQKM